MLQSLHVKNLALIDELEIEFHNGFNVMTGETGAGKSIIIGSVNLALGGRYQADILRHGAPFGFVELTFYVQNERQIANLQALDIFPEEGLVILNRRFMENRSYARINGEVVTAGKLKSVAEILIDIHGQHEHQSLLDKEKHLAILDEYGQVDIQAIKVAVEEAFAGYKTCQEQLKADLLDEGERQKKLSLLQFEVDEIAEANLTEAEDDLLEEQYKKMSHGKKILERLAKAHTLIGSDVGQGASEQIGRAVRAIQEVSQYDESVYALGEQLAEIDSLLQDCNRGLLDCEKSLEFSDADFAEIQTRLNAINHLKTKYGNTIPDIMLYHQEQEDELQKLVDYDTYIENLKSSYQAAAATLRKEAQKLSEARQIHALQLSKHIRGELSDLNFAEVQFEIAFKDKGTTTANGKDDVEFMVSLNHGEALKPLGNVASGGELSRIMLAIKSVLADKDDVETLIFDEIDVGISGRTAQKVSEKLARLSARHQVICITHLAQIAAMAEVHYLIEKKIEEGRTITDIRLLDSREEIGELARILGGVEITDAVLDNAKEMKDLAKNRRKI